LFAIGGFVIVLLGHSASFLPQLGRMHHQVSVPGGKNELFKK